MKKTDIVEKLLTRKNILDFKDFFCLAGHFFEKCVWICIFYLEVGKI